jgi:hypothetical protein
VGDRDPRSTPHYLVLGVFDGLGFGPEGAGCGHLIGTGRGDFGAGLTGVFGIVFTSVS